MIHKLLKLTSVAILLAFVTGCMTNVKEAGLSALETPTLEAQANRIVLGSSLLRINEVLINEMPISGDAKWPSELAKEVTEEDEAIIEQWIEDEPYLATKPYTDAFQRSQLGGYVNVQISPMTYAAYKKLIVLYGSDKNNAPDLFNYSTDFDNFLKFPDENVKLREVEASAMDEYRSLPEAVHALLPESYQEELKMKLDSMMDAQDEVVFLEKEIAQRERKLKGSEVSAKGGRKGKAKNLSESEATEIKQQIADLEIQLEKAKKDYEQKEEVYFLALEASKNELEKNISLTPEQVALAKNVFIVSELIKTGAMDALSLYGIATANLTTRSILPNFDRELATLVYSTTLTSIPKRKKKLIHKRYERLAKNAIYLIPSVGLGTFYAFVQRNIVSKYQEIAEIILEADKARVLAKKK